MFQMFLRNYIIATFLVLVAYGIFLGIGYAVYANYILRFLDYNIGLYFGVYLFFTLVSYHTLNYSKEDILKESRNEFNSIKSNLFHKISILKKEIEEAKSNQKSAERDSELWKISLSEKCSGFPSLLNSIQEYEKLKDSTVSDYLKYKKHPAKKAADIVKNEINVDGKLNLNIIEL